MSQQITVELPDGTSREYASGTTPAEVAASIGTPSIHGVRITLSPSASDWTAHDSEKCPVPGISTVWPGAAMLAIAASHAPCPFAAYR